MSEFFKSISDDDEIRQGDIIRKLDMTSMPRTTYGFILTADCDIAQRKAGERYTWLQILPVAEYIDGPWAREQLKKLSEKHAKNLCDYLNAQIKKVDASLLPLNPEKLAEDDRPSRSVKSRRRRVEPQSPKAVLAAFRHRCAEAARRA
jgi:hypothetical protein